MDQSTHSDTTNTTSNNAASTQRKKRSRSPEAIGYNDSRGGSLSSEDNGNNDQKESESGLEDCLTHKRQGRRLSSLNDVAQLRDRKIKRLRLEAIFHPKFENESSEKDVRKEMLAKVGNDEGYLEVTLKHSGSLLLWSGGSRFYSKNDANNMVTLVGEFLLRQHMSLVWGESSKYEDCSDYLQEHRLTLAFEVITSVLGDHGDVPKQPYLILLSVADRNTQQFYNSLQLIDFAQKFRLPHNDYWMFGTHNSCEKLFQFYDDIREIGTADTVIKGLDQLAVCADVDYIQTRRIASMYPHLAYQGNILEGLVVRFVENSTKDTGNQFLQSVNELSRVSGSNLSIMSIANENIIPPQKCLDDFFSSNDRQIIDSERELCSFLNNSQKLARAVGAERKGEYELSSLILDCIQNDQQLDSESEQIVQLIRSLKELGVKVEYKLYNEDISTESLQRQRWICIIHVIHDETFKKYRTAQKGNEMVLFRGFSFELVLDEPDTVNIDPLPTATLIRVNSTAAGNPLMLKMKFLPYMVRTFCCRNGLRVLSRSGIDGYEQYTLDLLKKWQISHNSIKEWQPYFYSWGMYAEAILKQQKQNCTNVQQVKYSSGDSKQLNSNTYLKYLSDFDALYRSGQLARVTNEKAKCHGLIIVISANKEDSSICGDFLSSKLRIRTRFDRNSSITEVEMLSTLCGSAALCNTIVEDSHAPIRRLINKDQYAEAIFVVLFGCSDEEIALKYEVGTPEHRKASGMSKAWGRLRCKEIFHLPKLSSEQLQDSIEAAKIIDRLIELSGCGSQEERRPGLLVHFPCIPGSGKSSLCSQDIHSYIKENAIRAKESDQQARPVIVCEGDTVKGKYWHHVLLERLKHPDSILVADKNATPNVWDTVKDTCIKSHAVSIPVLPDCKALCTVKVMHSDQECYYPYSLEYLAVCMLRVLRRPKDSHAGKLDESAEYAMLVVMMFYSLYRGITTEQFISMMDGCNAKGFEGAESTTIRVPFFNNSHFQELPKDLHEGLIDALTFLYSAGPKDLKTVALTETGRSMESRLRSLISKHQAFLESICASESESKAAFVRQLSDLSATLLICKQTDDSHVAQHKFIEIASIDIDKESIDEALQRAAADYTEVKCFLERIRETQKIDRQQEASTVIDGSCVKRPHVTMAHFSQLSQNSIVKEYSQADGQSIAVTITGMLIGESIAAFSVKLPEFLDGMESVETPPCQNAFPHTTVWVGSNESAAKSNSLPLMVENGQAVQVKFANDIVLPGKFCFWYI